MIKINAAQRLAVMAAPVDVGSVTKGKFTLKVVKDRKTSKDAKFFVNDVLVFHGDAELADEWLDGATEEKLKRYHDTAKRTQKKARN